MHFHYSETGSSKHPAMFGSFPSRRRPIKTQPVPLPAPTHPAVGQQQYWDGSFGALQSGSSVIGTWQENNESLAVITHIHTKTKTPRFKKTFPSSFQLWIARFRKMIELATNCASGSPTSGAARLKGEWQLTMSQWRQQAFKLDCPLDRCLCQWAAFWSREVQLHRPLWLTTVCAFWCFFRYCLDDQWCSCYRWTLYHGMGQRQCLAVFFGAKGNRPGFTSLIWFCWPNGS